MGRLFFAYFLLAKQKKVRRPAGRDPAPALSKGTPRTIKTIATSACYISARAKKDQNYNFNRARAASYSPRNLATSWAVLVTALIAPMP